jgi:hypothetical protein
MLAAFVDHGLDLAGLRPDAIKVDLRTAKIAVKNLATFLEINVDKG